MQFLVVALGNPGKKYSSTRHNIGQMLVDRYHSFSWKDKFKGHYDVLEAHGKKIYFLKPMTYMNLSGESVQPLCQFFKIERQNILVLHDEIDLPFGELALKKDGGLAGHNGLKSIAQCMGGNDFFRLRMGIGRPVHGTVADYVLGEFSLEENQELMNFLDHGIKAMDTFFSEGYEKAQNLFNKKKVKNKE